MNSTKKTYLFDFDGTLVDSMPYFIGVMLRILDENNIKYEKDIVKIITPLGYRGTAEYFKKLGLQGSVEEINDIKTVLITCALTDIRPAKTEFYF